MNFLTINSVQLVIFLSLEKGKNFTKETLMYFQETLIRMVMESRMLKMLMTTMMASLTPRTVMMMAMASRMKTRTTMVMASPMKVRF